MLVRFVHHIDALRRQGFGELLGNMIGGSHVVPVRARQCASQCLAPVNAWHRSMPAPRQNQVTCAHADEIKS
jgi:hypothetical protein